MLIVLAKFLFFCFISGGKPILAKFQGSTDLNQVRHHIEFNTDEIKAVRGRLTVFTMARTCIKVLDHNFPHSAQLSKLLIEVLTTEGFLQGHFISWTKYVKQHFNPHSLIVIPVKNETWSYSDSNLLHVCFTETPIPECTATSVGNCQLKVAKTGS